MSYRHSPSVVFDSATYSAVNRETWSSASGRFLGQRIMINIPLLVVYGTSGENLLSFIGDTAGESRKFALGHDWLPVAHVYTIARTETVSCSLKAPPKKIYAVRGAFSIALQYTEDLLFTLNRNSVENLLSFIGDTAIDTILPMILLWESRMLRPQLNFSIAEVHCKALPNST